MLGPVWAFAREKVSLELLYYPDTLVNLDTCLGILAKYNFKPIKQMFGCSKVLNECQV